MGSNCGKGFLYFYNLIFLAISGVLVYLSVLFVWRWGDYASLTANSYAIVPAGIILIVSILVFITAVVGCCGVCHENKCTLGVFISLLLFLITAEIVAGSLAYIEKDQIKTELHNNLQESFLAFYDKHSNTREAFESMQESLHCCGLDGPSDWKNMSKPIPQSCCIHLKSGAGCVNYRNNVYKKGCYEQLISSFKKNLVIISGVVIGFAVLQVIGVMMTIYMIVVLKKNGYIRMLENNQQQKMT